MIKRYIVILLVFLVIDAAWLGLVAPKLYKSQIGHLMAEKTNLYAALIFYFIYALALLVFIVNPSVDKQSVMHALIYGAFLGFVMYATYDLTNLATLKDWPISITVIDLVWGTFVKGLTSAAASKIIQTFNF